MRITQCLQQATVKWYHLNETAIENYRASRLRPMLVCCGLMMSNAFLLLAEAAFQDILFTYLFYYFIAKLLFFCFSFYFFKSEENLHSFVSGLVLFL